MWTALLSRPFFLGFLFLFVILLFLLPVEIRITIDNIRQNKSVSGELIILLGGKVKLWQARKTSLANYQIDSLLKQYIALLFDKDEKNKNIKAQLQKIVGNIFRLMRACIWQKFDLYLKLGIGDPALTALLTGFLHYLSGQGSSHILRLLSFKKGSRPHFLFYPSFLSREIIVLFSVEFTINGLKLIYHSIKIFNGIILGPQGLNIRRRSKKCQSIQYKV